MSNTRIWAISIVGLMIVWLLAVSAASLSPVLWALFLAYFMHPLVLLFERRLGLRRIYAVILTFVLLVLLLSVLIGSILPLLINQLMVFARDFSMYSADFMGLVDRFQKYLYEIGLDSRIISQMDVALSQLFSMVGSYIRAFASSIFNLVSKITEIVIVFILLFYFLMDGQKMIGHIVSSAPAILTEAISNLIDGIDVVVWGYMKNQFIISVIHGAVSVLAYALIGLPYSGLLGFIAGVLNMIPYFGSIIAALIVIIVASLQEGVSRLVLTTIAVVGLNLVIGNILTPRIQAKTLGIHPVVVITALLICTYLWGAVGMFLAVPMLGLAHRFLIEFVRVAKNL